MIKATNEDYILFNHKFKVHKYALYGIAFAIGTYEIGTGYYAYKTNQKFDQMAK